MPENNTGTPSDEKLDFKKVLPVFVIVLVDLLGLTIIIPLLPLYAVTFGADPLTIGLLQAAYPVMQFIGAPLLGRLSDQYGRKPVLVISQIGTLIGFIVLGFANSLWMLFASRIVDGLSGANISTAQAVITDSTTAKTRTQGLGLIGAAFGLGFVIGPIIAFAALWASKDNYAVPAFIAAGCSLASVLLTAFWLPETLTEEQRGKGSTREAFSFGAMGAALTRPGIGILLILMFAQQIAFGGFESFLALFNLNRLGLGGRDNAAVFVFAGVMIVLVQGYFAGQWSKKLGDRRLIMLGLAALTVGLILTAFTPPVPVPWYSKTQMTEALSSGAEPSHNVSATSAISLPDDTSKGWLGLGWILVAMIPAAIGGGTLHPAINSLITKRADPNEIGGMLGISAALLSGANALAPLFMNLLFGWFGSTAPFLVGGLILGLLLIISTQAIKPGREEQIPTGLARGAASH